MVKSVVDNSEFKQIIAAANLTVVDYFATWCGPCKKVSPFIEQLSSKYTDVTFIKVDVDEAAEISQERDIQAMPTFHFYKNGQLLESLQGADPGRLEALVIQHKVVVPMKNPSDMTIKELKAAIVNLGLAPKALGMIEKQEFINLLNEYNQG